MVVSSETEGDGDPPCCLLLRFCCLSAIFCISYCPRGRDRDEGDREERDRGHQRERQRQKGTHCNNNTGRDRARQQGDGGDRITELQKETPSSPSLVRLLSRARVMRPRSSVSFLLSQKETRKTKRPGSGRVGDKRMQARERKLTRFRDWGRHSAYRQVDIHPFVLLEW